MAGKEIRDGGGGCPTAVGSSGARGRRGACAGCQVEATEMEAMLGVRRVGDWRPGVAVSQWRRAHRKAKQRRARRRGVAREERASKGRSGAKKGQSRPSGEARAAGRGRVVPVMTKMAATAAPLFGQKEEERNKGSFVNSKSLLC